MSFISFLAFSDTSSTEHPSFSITAPPTVFPAALRLKPRGQRHSKQRFASPTLAGACCFPQPGFGRACLPLVGGRCVPQPGSAEHNKALAIGLRFFQPGLGRVCLPLAGARFISQPGFARACLPLADARRVPQPGLCRRKETLAMIFLFLQPGLSVGRLTLAVDLFSRRPGFEPKNQPWLRYFVLPSQGCAYFRVQLRC